MEGGFKNQGLNVICKRLIERRSELWVRVLEGEHGRLHPFITHLGQPLALAKISLFFDGDLFNCRPEKVFVEDFILCYHDCTPFIIIIGLGFTQEITEM